MSDVSVLSHEYKTASELSQLVSESLILLKKVHFELPGVSEADAASIGERVQALADVLVRLRGLIDGEQTPVAGGALQIPGTLVARLQREHGGSLARYLDDLRRVADHLAFGVPKVDDRDLQLLDEFASVTDAEASRVFRQMMRR